MPNDLDTAIERGGLRTELTHAVQAAHDLANECGRLRADLAHAETARADLRKALAATAAVLRSTEALLDERHRRLTEILDLIDGREDIDGSGGPNIFMRIAMTARGEDRP